MEPTTLYVLYKLQDGLERVREFAFDSVAECEAYRATIPDRIKVVRYSCEAYTPGLQPPNWYRAHLDNKVIHGVPLDPKHYR